MKLITQSPKKALKAFLKQRPSESERDKFKNNLIALLDKISVIEKQPKDESEEHLKNNLRDFLRDTYYIESNAINTKDKKDLVIHIGKTTDTDVAVIIEAKRPSNKNEMVSADNANKKALHELILYYLTERNAKENVQLKQLVVTDINQWFIIDANYFDKHIYRNTQIRKLYETKVNDKKDNPWFYEEIAKIVSKIDVEIPCVYFDIRDYEKILRNTATNDDKELVALYKILSPQHLLKIATPNDSNTLNERFYKELLHIIGLEEAREGTKNVIRRKKENKNAASLIELTIEALKTEDTFHRIPDIKVYGENKEEQTFNIALELCITWINRILFLKLLEGQLISYHQGNKDYRFLNSATIHDYDELFKLFHKVLAVNIPDRTEAIKTKYSRVPYLNSSLFEISELEDQTIKINSLENDGQLELINTTILKEIKKKAATLPSLDYLFQFLDAYDFASEGTEDWQKDNKQLINASVLGKVFEKINGYRDGSIFTPAFITMYMCRQSIRLAVVEKFNETLSEKGKKLFDKFEDIKNYTSRHYKTEDVLKANEIINSLHICDPAVGSGHFLVSALNEIIAVKAELGILADDKGNNLSGYEIETVNDELIITDQQGNPIEYKLQNGKPISKEVQRLQKTLFHQKQTIIENCLFGVDINPKSVLICRLRLWIELLKNAYYKEAEYTELETLPNIDINIKCGNSLVSRFAIDADLKQALKKSKWTIDSYRIAVDTYRNAESKEQKREMERLIADIKSDFRSEISLSDPKVKKLRKLSGELFQMTNQQQLFEMSKKEKADWNKKVQQLSAETKKLETEIEAIKANKIFENAFEWRFEFPEVLNVDGDFVGFDVVIGNPPYGALFSENEKTFIKSNFQYCDYQFDIYMTFFERSYNLLKDFSQLCFIVPNTWLLNLKTPNIRKLLFSRFNTHNVRAYSFPVFEEAVVDTIIVSAEKKNDLSGSMTVQIIDKNGNTIENQFSKSELAINYQSHVNIYLSDFASKIDFKFSALSKLDNVAKITQGTKPFQKGKGKPKQDEKTMQEKPFVQSYKKDNTFRPLLRGSLINKYVITWNDDYYISLGDWLAEPRYSANYDAPLKIVIRQTGSSLIATIDDRQFVVRDNLYTIISTSKEYSEHLILACLNSKLLNWYYQNIVNNEVGEALAQVKRGHLEILPMPKYNKVIFETVVSLTQKILDIKQANNSADTTDFENQIDQLVYQLYELTEEEIKIIENA